MSAFWRRILFLFHRRLAARFLTCSFRHQDKARRYTDLREPFI